MKMAKSNKKILSLLMLGLLFVKGQGLDLLEDNSDINNEDVLDLDQMQPEDLDQMRPEIENAIMASPVATMIIEVAPNFLEVLYKATKCTLERLKQWNVCDFNGTFDPFTNVRECSQSTGFTEIVNRIQDRIPAVNVSVGVPEFQSQSRCFDPEALIDPRNVESTLSAVQL